MTPGLTEHHRTACLAFFAVLLVAPTGLSDAQTLAWSFKTDGAVYSSPTVSEGGVYIGSGDGYVYALDAATGGERWRFETGGAVHSTPAVDRGTVYVMSHDGFLYALSAQDGTERWRFATGGERVFDTWDYYLSSPVVTESLVLFGSGDHRVYAVERDSGSPRWSFATDDVVHAEPAVSDTLVYVGSYDGHLYALHLADGSVAWDFDTVGATYFPKGAVQKGALVEDGVVYFGSRDYNVYALDAATGTGHWNRKEPSGWVVATPTVSGDRLFVGTSDSHLFLALDAASGALLWSLPVPMRVYGAAAVQNDVVYFGCHNGLLYAVRAGDGTVLWTYATEGHRANASRVYTEDGEFRDDFELYGEQWQASERAILSLGSILSTPAIADGVIYFGSADGKVYAVELP